MVVQKYFVLHGPLFNQYKLEYEHAFCDYLSKYVLFSTFDKEERKKEAWPIKASKRGGGGGGKKKKVLYMTQKNAG